MTAIRTRSFLCLQHHFHKNRRQASATQLFVNLFFPTVNSRSSFKDQPFTILSKATEQYLQGDIYSYILIRRKRVIDKFPSSSSILTQQQTPMLQQGGEFLSRRLGGGRLNLPVLSCMELCKAWGEVPCVLEYGVGVKNKSAQTFLRIQRLQAMYKANHTHFCLLALLVKGTQAGAFKRYFPVHTGSFLVSLSLPNQQRVKDC